MANGLVPIGSRAATLAEEADISDELSGAGIAFGTLVERTGAAVAATQNRLNETGADTASALARTLVDVIAVEEKIYLDDGTLDTSVAHTRRLPLISLIDPVFYQWTSVRLQGRFQAREFNTSSSSTTTSRSSSFGTAQGGLFFFIGVGAFSDRSSSDTRTLETETSSDVSRGQMRMNALLEPRDDVTIPKPNQAIRGPRLTLIQGPIEDVLDGATLVGRTMSILIQFNRRNGDAIPGKAISVDTDGVPWAFVTGPGAVTDAAGQVEIQLRRSFPDEESDTAPADFVVSARIGLVQNTISVTF